MTVGEYNRCVERFSDNVYRFALKSLRDPEAAKDVVQESFLRLWENRAAVMEGKEKSYLFTITYRLLVDTVRWQGRFGGGEEALRSVEAGPGSEPDVREKLEEALEALPALQKTLVMLRDYEGYSYREIGEMTGLSESQVKVYIFRARVALKARLGKLENMI